MTEQRTTEREVAGVLGGIEALVYWFVYIPGLLIILALAALAIKLIWKFT